MKNKILLIFLIALTFFSGLKINSATGKRFSQAIEKSKFISNDIILQNNYF